MTLRTKDLVKKVVDDIRLRNKYRKMRQQENKQRGLSGKGRERKRRLPSPIEDIDTLLRILDNGNT